MASMEVSRLLFAFEEQFGFEKKCPMGYNGLTRTQAFRHFGPFLGGLPCRDIHTLETATG